MPKYILTGAPGAGKTVLIRALEWQGHDVVNEAATDLIALDQAQGIAEPWTEQDFTARIARLQRQRLARAGGDTQFHDRSAICTLALARWLGHPVSAALAEAVEEARAQFEPLVFFPRLLGFITHTEARRISLEEARAFEALHEAVYREQGFELFYLEPESIESRLQSLLGRIGSA
ncbi:ATPase [Devosia sp. H5989]|nr:ATPase [Devosia sp. H5989]